MVNAREEFLNIFKRYKNLNPLSVKCAVIGYNPDSMVDLDVDDIINGKDCIRRAILPIGWKNNNWDRFLQDLNFNYDDGYGSQELYGIVWFKDGSWFKREEEDGLEWWVYTSVPQIPDEMLL